MDLWCEAIVEEVFVDVVQPLLADTMKEKEHPAADGKALVAK